MSWSAHDRRPTGDSRHLEAFQAVEQQTVAGPYGDRVAVKPRSAAPSQLHRTRRLLERNTVTTSRHLEAHHREHWFTRDSAPIDYSVLRSPWAAPTTLVIFVMLASLMLYFTSDISELYDGLLTSWLGQPSESSAVFEVRLRLFFPAFFVAFASLAAGSVGQRARLILLLLTPYLAIVVAVDGVSRALMPIPSEDLLLLAGNVVIGFAAIGWLSLALLIRCRLPRNSSVHSLGHDWPIRDITLLSLVVLAASALAIAASLFLGSEIEAAREVGLLGGLGPGVVLFLPCLGLGLVAIGLMSRSPSTTKPGNLPVAVLVAALNEEHGIEACIEALDEAATRYQWPVRLYLVDNGSSDATVRVAEKTLKGCKTLTGTVGICTDPGKARALNQGLRSIDEPVVLRVDADTVIHPEAIARVAAHFDRRAGVGWRKKKAVGAVGGLPLPGRIREEPPAPYMERMRAIEVYLTHGFARMAQAGVDAIMSLPGIFCAYQRSALDSVGGFAEGMNGEDTDAAFRIGRLGYRLTIDRRITAWSETPTSFAQLRDQRIRWYRSVFHVAARNSSAVLQRQGLRAIWTLPWALVQTARRAMTVPLLLFGMLVVATGSTVLSVRDGAVLLALALGVTGLVTAVGLVLHRQFRLLLQVPAYAGFRILRAHYTLEALLTLPLAPTQRNASTRPFRRWRGAHRSRARRRRGAHRR